MVCQELFFPNVTVARALVSGGEFLAATPQAPFTRDHKSHALPSAAAESWRLSPNVRENRSQRKRSSTILNREARLAKNPLDLMRASPDT